MEAEIYNLRLWLKETKAEELRKVFDALLSTSGFHILAFTEHYFPIQGYTALWLLGESHLALHSFPEKGHTYLELSSCNKQSFRKFQQLLKEKAISYSNKEEAYSSISSID